MPSNDALEKLLITKYGVPEKQARNYAAQIIAGGGGGHEGALKAEALTTVADTEQKRMEQWLEWANLVAMRKAGLYTEGDRVSSEYAEAVADSDDRTWQNAMAAPEPPRPPAPQVDIVPPTFADQLSSPVNQRRAMGRDTLVPLEVPEPESTIGPASVAKIPPQDPYMERLRRATEARRAMLGN